MRVWVPLLFLCLSACQAPWQTLRPDQEGRFAAVLDAGAPDLPEGWEWHNAWVGQTDATITYGLEGQAPANCALAPLCLTLHHPSRQRPEDVPAGEFVVRIAARSMTLGSLRAQGIAQGLARRLGDEAGFWEGHLVWALVLVEGGLALVLASLLLSLAARRSRRRTLFFGGLITVVGFALRLLLVVPGPFHENHHGLISVHNVVTGGAPFHHVTSAYYALLQWPVKWLGGGERTVFWLGALIGSLGAPVWAVLAARLARDEKVGWIALAIWTCMPLAVRMSPTETPFILASLLLPGAALALGWGARQDAGWQSGSALVLGTLLVALLCQCRVLTVLYLPVPALLGAALLPGPGARPWKVLGVATLVSAALVWPHAMDILAAATVRSETGRYISIGNLATSLWQGRMLVFRPAVVAPTVLPLALMGWAALAAQGRRVSFGSGLALLWMVLATGLVSTCSSLHFALELPLVALLGTLMAVGCVALTRRVCSGVSRWPVMGLLAASCLLSWQVYGLLPPDTQEYRFLVDEVIPQVGRTPGGALRVGGGAAGGREPIPLSWWRAQLPGKDVRFMGLEGAPESGALVYTGLVDQPVGKHGAAACDRGSPSDLSSAHWHWVVEPMEDRFLCVDYCRQWPVVLRLTMPE